MILHSFTTFSIAPFKFSLQGKSNIDFGKRRPFALIEPGGLIKPGGLITPPGQDRKCEHDPFVGVRLCLQIRQTRPKTRMHGIRQTCPKTRMLEIRQTCLKTNMLESVRDLRPCPGAGLKPGPATGLGNYFPKAHIEAKTDEIGRAHV